MTDRFGGLATFGQRIVWEGPLLCYDGAMLQAMLCALFLPALALASSPGPTPVDPLAQPLESYEQLIVQRLSPWFTEYQALTQPGNGLPELARPRLTLDRLREAQALGALPAPWVKALNSLGESEEARGLAAAAEAPVPEEYRSLEPLYVGQRPPGGRVRPLEELPAVLSGKPAAAVAPVFATLRTLQATPGPGSLAEYARTAREVERLFEARCVATQAEALRPLRSRIDVLIGPAPIPASECTGTPWRRLHSPAVEKRVLRYFAERYFKGRWEGGQGAAASTGDGKGTGSGTGTPSVKDTTKPDKEGGGGTGSGEPKPLPSGTGTGSGTSSPGSAAPGPDGTGDGRAGER